MIQSSSMSCSSGNSTEETTELPKKQIDEMIVRLFRVKPRDIPPYTGWLKPSNREHLAQVMRDAGFTIGAEIGVARGKNAKILCETIPNLELYCIDPWIKYSNWTQEKMDQRYEDTVKRLAPYNVKIVRKTSMEAVKDFDDQSLDFIHIDGFHDFDWVMMDMIRWIPKVRPGGIVSGHDYYPFYRGGVMTAVDAYVKAHNIRDWYVTREKEPSWFWVKD